MSSPEPLRRRDPIAPTATQQPIGIDSVLAQKANKTLYHGIPWNCMIVGQSGCGKSTFVNTLFGTHLVDSKATTKSSDEGRKTTEIVETTAVLEEKGMKLNLTVIDTPGFADTINGSGSWDPIVKFIKDRYGDYLRKELNPQRERSIPDTRVHCVLYFINPNGQPLSRLDLCAMKAISAIANLIPIISKADTLTEEEKELYKLQIRSSMEHHDITSYPPASPFDNDLAQHEINCAMKAHLPFAVIGSERSVVVDGKAIRGRRCKWGGVINVDNPAFSDTPVLRDFIIRKCLNDLLLSTASLHYENFRTQQLMALKEAR